MTEDYSIYDLEKVASEIRLSYPHVDVVVNERHMDSDAYYPYIQVRTLPEYASCADEIWNKYKHISKKYLCIDVSSTMKELLLDKLNDMQNQSSEFEKQTDDLYENKIKDIVRDRTKVIEYYKERIDELVCILR